MSTSDAATPVIPSETPEPDCDKPDAQSRIVALSVDNLRLERENATLRGQLREANDKLTFLLTSMDEGSLPYWQRQHDEMCIQLADVLKKLTEANEDAERLYEVLQRYGLRQDISHEAGIVDACTAHRARVEKEKA